MNQPNLNSVRVPSRTARKAPALRRAAVWTAVSAVAIGAFPVVLATIPAAEAGSTTASWSMFMHDATHTGAQGAETKISPSTASLMQPAWIDHDAGSGGYYGSSPIVYRRHVYVGDEAGQVTKRNAATGSMTGGWTVSTFNSVYATPAVGPVHTSGGLKTMVFAGDLSGFVYAIDDATGTVVWSHQSPSGLNLFGGPSLVGNVLYTAGMHGDVTAWNADTGAIRWSVNPARPAGTRQYGSPTVIGSKVYVGDTAGNLWAIDGTDPTPAPLATFENAQLTGTVASDGTHLFFLVGYNLPSGVDQHAIAYDLGSGTVTWNVDLGRHPGVVSYDVPSPALGPGIVLFPTDLEIAALSPTSGAVLYRTATVDRIEPTTPAIANGVFFIAGVQAAGASVGALEGFVLATGEPLYFTRIPEVANSSPAICDGRVYVGSGNVSGNQGDGVLYAFEVSPHAS